MRPLAYYVTAHGYGHGVRSCDILRALIERRPDLPIVVTTELPEAFIRNRVDGPGLRIRRAAFDVGMVQLDSIRVDVEATLRRVEALHRDHDARVQREAEALRGMGVAAVVADIPGIPIAAAHALGLPALAVSNFSWDWIYSAFADRDPAWRRHIELFQQDYGKADLLLRLPFSDAMTAFPRQEQLAVLARPAASRRSEIARHYRIDPARPWALLSFTTLELGDAALARIRAMRGYELLTVRPLEWEGRPFHAVDRERFSFAEVLASADVVVTKPGYGIVSECVVNRKPMVWADRTDFLEAPILEASIRRHLRQAHIPAGELYAGNLAPYLDAALADRSEPEPCPQGGADKAARRILSYYDAV